MGKRLNEQQIEEMAFELRRFLIDHRLWSDTCICFNGKAFATYSQFEDDEDKRYADNNPNALYTIEDVDVYQLLRIKDTVLSMSFEGPLAFFLGRQFPCESDMMDRRARKSTPLDDAQAYVRKGLMDIFQKRGLIYEMQTRYKLTARYPDEVREEKTRRIQEGENVFISPEEAEAQDALVKEDILSKYRAQRYTGEDIIIPNTFTKIGNQAFICRNDIKRVILPEGVTQIGNAAFFDCESLVYIEIPDSVQGIEPLALHETPWYENHPNGLVYAGKVAYAYKGELPENAAIVLKNGTTAIADQAFGNSLDGLENLVSVTIPDSVTTIGEEQFENCTGVFKKNVTIRCAEGSTAHRYARENEMKYELMQTEGA